MFTNRNELCSLIGMSHVTPLRVMSAGAFTYALMVVDKKLRSVRSIRDIMQAHPHSH